jgi:hypothetical protein
VSFHSSTAFTQFLNIDYKQLYFDPEQKKLQCHRSATPEVVAKLARILIWTVGYDMPTKYFILFGKKRSI